MSCSSMVGYRSRNETTGNAATSTAYRDAAGNAASNAMGTDAGNTNYAAGETGNTWAAEDADPSFCLTWFN